MPVKDIKIGHAVVQYRNVSGRSSSSGCSKSSTSSKSSANQQHSPPKLELATGIYPVIYPFPPPAIPPSISPPKLHAYQAPPSPKVGPPQIEPFPAPRTSSTQQKAISKTITGRNCLLPNVPPANYRNMILNQGKVKSVQSGDSLVLVSAKNPTSERILSLAYCQAPRLKKDNDEPWAFEAREALRKLVVGKNIQFSVLYSIPNTNREYGIVYLGDGRKLPEVMVQEGWLKLRDDAGRKEDSDEAQQQLVSFQNATKRSE
jgi:endonuclease YncB( thermonuclease family)